jgi:serine/threonine protein kinase/tetratricopeptide (TPR) repeat protein
LEVPAAAVQVATAELEIGPRAGGWIGRYRLLEQIGEGGMGTVWHAEQTEPVRRRVAIKLIKPGMDSRQVLARFEAERQALALMDHPNIAKVFDGGVTPHGRPYFVMEYVKGTPLGEYCDQARLTVLERLRLFIPICKAVQHAHLKGIIHRDLKPSNILICLYDGQPVPKVIDFGLAKALHQPLTEQTLFTAHGMMVGTPLYMSPEQAELNNLDVDTRADVYSLGVVLYELLTGSTPLEKGQLKAAAINEILRLIKEFEPPKPSLRLSSAATLASIAAQRSLDPKQLCQAISGDLDWIVMKSLEKERSRRYETATGLARDIERFLADEPVEARPPSASYRLRKALRRHRGPVLASALVLLTLLGGLVGTGVGLYQARQALSARNFALAKEARQRIRAEDEQRRANLNLAESRKEKKRADANLADARRAVSEYLVLVAADEQLRSADFHALRKRLLESAIPFLNNFVKQSSSDPKVEVERVQALLSLADLRHALGDFDQAAADYHRAIDIQERRLDGDSRSIEERLNFANSLNSAGRNSLLAGRSEEAGRAFRRAAEVAEPLRQDRDASAQQRSVVALIHVNLGEHHRREGRLREAAEEIRAGLAVFDPLKEPADGVRQQLFAGARLNLAIVLAQNGRFVESRQEFDVSVKLLEEILAKESRNADRISELINVQLNLAKLLREKMNRSKDAEQVLRQAWGRAQELAGRFPNLPNYRRQQAEAAGGIGAILKDDPKRRDEAASLLDSALTIHKSLAAGYPDVLDYRQALAVSHYHVAELHRARGQLDDAEREYRVAAELEHELVERDSDNPERRLALSQTLVGLSHFLATSGRLDGAEAELREAVKVVQDLADRLPMATSHIEYRTAVAQLHYNLAGVLLQEKKIETGIEQLERAYEVLGELVRDSNGNAEFKLRLTGVEQMLATIHNDCAWTMATHPDEDRRSGAKAVKHGTRACELTKWAEWSCLNALAAAHAENGEFPLAIKRQEEALAKVSFVEGLLIKSTLRARLELYKAGKPFRDPTAPNAQGPEKEDEANQNK